MDYGGIQLKIIIDGMGGDYAPQSVVEGAVKASAQTEHEMIIVGDEAQISALLAKHKYKGNNIKLFMLVR